MYFFHGDAGRSWWVLRSSHWRSIAFFLHCWASHSHYLSEAPLSCYHSLGRIEWCQSDIGLTVNPFLGHLLDVECRAIGFVINLFTLSLRWPSSRRRLAFVSQGILWALPAYGFGGLDRLLSFPAAQSVVIFGHDRLWRPLAEKGACSCLVSVWWSPYSLHPRSKISFRLQLS